MVNNYRPISTLCILAKVFERLVSNQLKDFLEETSILSRYQSGFRKKHSTVSAALKVLNDIIEALDLKKVCAALFIDLSKAFDTVDHNILIDTLHKVGLSEHAVSWFRNYLSGRSQCVRIAGSSSTFLRVSKRVPQGSVLIYINDLCNNLSDVFYHFYADDTIIYCFASVLRLLCKLSLSYSWPSMSFRPVCKG